MNNNAALGYAIMAMKNLGYDDKKIEAVIQEMRSIMDFKTEEEAEEKYMKF